MNDENNNSLLSSSIMRMFSPGLWPELTPLSSTSTSSSSPTFPLSQIPITVASDEKFLYICAEMPGFDKETINADICGNKLCISGEKKKPQEMKVSYSNAIYGFYKRTITLPISVVNKNNVKVTYSDGILTIKIDSQKEKDKKFKITLSTASKETVE